MRLFQVDAFTKEKFKGNQAGVFLADKPLNDTYMQSVASEMNLSETAFTWLSNGRRIIKYFTPTVEVDLCGHATLATAHILWEQGVEKSLELTFIANNEVEVKLEKEGAKISFSFPMVSSVTSNFSSQDYCNLSGKEVLVSDNGWLTILADSVQEVRSVEMNSERLISEDRALIVTSEASHVDFVLRVFAPHAGIPEDPVTGLAQTIVSPIWVSKLNRTKLSSEQVSKRSGLLWSETKDSIVKVSGYAVTMFELIMT